MPQIIVTIRRTDQFVYAFAQDFPVKANGETLEECKCKFLIALNKWAEENVLPPFEQSDIEYKDAV